MIIYVKDIVVIGDKFTYFFRNDKHFSKKKISNYMFWGKRTIFISHREYFYLTQNAQNTQIFVADEGLRIANKEFTEFFCGRRRLTHHDGNSQNLHCPVGRETILWIPLDCQQVGRMPFLCILCILCEIMMSAARSSPFSLCEISSAASPFQSV